ncbi:AraC-like DNA-binding protein [Natranaerovirga pectinivora]|uniref:AraC-like DNA-binding protein n=1 Tax=Natranaerovirga pectinivora TaxID=682400 RepID=A0A4R3MN21_9FIRM|nr:AraC family transcriptional regulator [Natranaerovirga pectinivora]TCT15424.1 AraC-like DNA-binding protein [Natranaerovirga pectinivora]
MDINIHYPRENIDEYYKNYKMEISLINKICTNELDEALNIWDDLINKGFFYDISGNKDTIRSLKNHMIGLCSLLCHNVIVRGVSPYTAKAKTKAFISLVEKTSSIIELTAIGKDIITAYSKQVSSLVKVEDECIKKALNYIHNHLGEDITLDEVANEVCLSKCYFCSQFKKETKMTFSNYLTHIRIERSKFLLKHSDKSILDIAISLGFSSQSYFSSQFKKHTNMSPKKYRSSML